MTDTRADFAGYRDVKGAQREVCRMMYDYRADFEALSKEAVMLTLDYFPRGRICPRCGAIRWRGAMACSKSGTWNCSPCLRRAGARGGNAKRAREENSGLS